MEKRFILEAEMIQPGQISFREVPIPRAGEGEVIIRVKRIGVCGSDIHVWHGKHPYTSYPVIQGHELSGEITEVGPGVKFTLGDRVTVQPQVVCGNCPPCRGGNYNICNSLKVMGFQTEGGAREYWRVDTEKVVKIPNTVSFEEGAMVEPLAVAVHALSRAREIKGKDLLVLGAGPIGNLVAQAAKGLGANRVMITDISDFRLQVAKEVGADFCVNPNKQDLNEMLVEKFGGKKADLILECVGSAATINQAIECARKGSEITVVGVYPEKVEVNMGFVQDRELRLTGTLMYKREDYLTAIDLLARKKIQAEKLISVRFLFKDYEKAYRYIDEKKDKIMKVMIEVG